MKAIRKRIYKAKLVLQEILKLRKKFYNWDNILKRAINGKTTQVLRLRNGLVFMKQPHIP